MCKKKLLDYTVAKRDKVPPAWIMAWFFLSVIPCYTSIYAQTLSANHSMFVYLLLNMFRHVFSSNPSLEFFIMKYPYTTISALELNVPWYSYNSIFNISLLYKMIVTKRGLVTILVNFFCFYYLQCLRDAFLMIKWRAIR